MLFHKKKQKYIVWSLIGVGVLVALVLIFWLWSVLTTSYCAVYTVTGDLYFGELRRFPDMKLSHVWYLQKGGDSLSFEDFSKAAWKPKGDVYLNDESVVWFAPIHSQSDLLPYLKGEKVATHVGGSENAEPMVPSPTVQTPSTSSKARGFFAE